VNWAFARARRDVYGLERTFGLATKLIAIRAETVSCSFINPLPWQSREELPKRAFVQASCKEPESVCSQKVFPDEELTLVIVPVDIALCVCSDVDVVT